MTDKLRVLLLTILLVALALGVFAYQALRPPVQALRQPEVSPAFTEEEESLIRKILTVEQGFRAYDAIQSLFVKADEDRIDRLKRHPNDGIAIRAAWRKCDGLSRKSRPMPW